MSLYALPQMAYVIVTELCIINMIANCFFLLKEQIKNFICVNLCNMFFCVPHDAQIRLQSSAEQHKNKLQNLVYNIEFLFPC